jgi:type 1 glutamine amidotransferase
MSITIVAALLGAALQAQAPAPQTATEKPAFERAPDALERVTWRTRTLVGDDRLTKWKLAIPAGGLTFLETIVRADAAVVDFVEGSNTQRVSPQLPKMLDHGLTADEIATIRGRMGPVRMLTYRVDRLDAAPASRRKVFEFAKAMAVDTIVVPSTTPLAGLDGLADEFAVNVAVLADSARPVRLMKELEGRSQRLGAGVDTGLWVQDGLSPRDGLAGVKDRLLYLSLRDRSARGASARNVPFGRGAGNMPELFRELNRLNVRPLAMTLDMAGVVNAPADLFRAIDAFEDAVQPAYGMFFTELSRAAPVRRDLFRPARGEQMSAADIQRRSDEVRQKIEAAIPRQPYAKPKKPRRLLVIDACLAGMSHDTIPLVNVMLESMGRITGAWEAELNNDLNNLKYPRIKQYDAVFLNDNVGELLPDPAVREGLARFVKEGGGLGGVHGTPWASRNWDEFGEMIGAKSAPHRIEQGIMRVYDPASPIVKPFGGKPLNFREEYYRFNHDGPNRLQWEDVRVLLTVDLDDPKVEPRPWNGYKRPDNIYPVTWIRSYGKGRSFYSSLGHMTDTFTTPEIVGHFLAGVQFLMGDLEADTTPNPRQRPGSQGGRGAVPPPSTPRR